MIIGLFQLSHNSKPTFFKKLCGVCVSNLVHKQVSTPTCQKYVHKQVSTSSPFSSAVWCAHNQFSTSVFLKNFSGFAIMHPQTINGITINITRYNGGCKLWPCYVVLMSEIVLDRYLLRLLPEHFSPFRWHPFLNLVLSEWFILILLLGKMSGTRVFPGDGMRYQISWPFVKTKNAGGSVEFPQKHRHVKRYCSGNVRTRAQEVCTGMKKMTKRFWWEYKNSGP